VNNHLSQEMIAMLCRHCHFATVSRPRGLCWACYYRPGVRDLYPSTSKYGRRGLGNFNGKGAMPPTATDAPPGSPEKVRILMERAQLRQSLWHPDDAALDGPKPRKPQLQQVG
jgi:hypothetical protein